MKEYYSIQLEDEDAQALLDITLLTNEQVRSILFPGDINTAIENFDFRSRETYWYENHHVIGLCFDHTGLNELPESIGKMSCLRFLVIHSSQIQTLPFTFKKLHNLEYLFFYNSPETSEIVHIDFPDIFQHLKNLKLFRFYGMFNVYLPPSFIELENLVELILEHCFFSPERSNYMRNLGNSDLEIEPNFHLIVVKKFFNLSLLR